MTHADQAIDWADATARRGRDDRAARLAVLAARLDAIADESDPELDALGEQIAAIVAEQAEILPRFDQPW